MQGVAPGRRAASTDYPNPMTAPPGYTGSLGGPDVTVRQLHVCVRMNEDIGVSDATLRGSAATAPATALTSGIGAVPANIPGTASMSTSDWALILFLAVLWGGSFFFSKVAVGDFPPLTVALGRVGIAALVLHVLVRIRREALPATLKEWAPYVTMGLFNNVLPFGLIFWGQTHIGSGLAATINATVPLFSALIMHVVARTPAERLNPRRSLGLVVGFIGVVVLIGPDVLGGIGSNVLAQLAVVAAAISYGISAAYSRRFYGTPPLRSATAQLTCSTALLLPVVVLTEHPWTIAAPSLAAWSSLLALGIFCTALGYLIFFRVLASAGALNLVLVTFLIPVTAMLLGTIFLDEVITSSTLLAMAIISLGLAIIDGRLWRRIRGVPRTA